MTENISHQRLCEIITYDPETGIFRRLKGAGCSKAGKVVGWKNGNGYIRIDLDKKTYYAHRLAWFYIHQQWPAETVDHIDCNPSNNRISNLRIATFRQNVWNSRGQNNGLLKGVTYRAKRRKWVAQIGVQGTTRYLGIFESEELAHEAYWAAAQKYFGKFARAA